MPEKITEIITAKTIHQVTTCKHVHEISKCNRHVFCVFNLTIKNHSQSASHPNTINNPYSRKSFAVTLSIEYEYVTVLHILSTFSSVLRKSRLKKIYTLCKVRVAPNEVNATICEINTIQTASGINKSEASSLQSAADSEDAENFEINMPQITAWKNHEAQR